MTVVIEAGSIAEAIAEDLAEIADVIEAAIARAVRLANQAAVAELIRRTPFVTGQTRRSMRQRFRFVGGSLAAPSGALYRAGYNVISPADEWWPELQERYARLRDAEFQKLQEKYLDEFLQREIDRAIASLN